MTFTPGALRNIFTHHPPTGNQVERYEAIRDDGHVFAEAIVDLCPPSRELTLAVRNIEQAVMWANAAIARNEVDPLEKGDSA